MKCIYCFSQSFSKSTSPYSHKCNVCNTRILFNKNGKVLKYNNWNIHIYISIFSVLCLGLIFLLSSFDLLNSFYSSWLFICCVSLFLVNKFIEGFRHGIISIGNAPTIHKRESEFLFKFGMVVNFCLSTFTVFAAFAFPLIYDNL